MAHNLATTNGMICLAYREGDRTPWHGLGQPVSVNAERGEWISKAGFNFDILQADVLYQAPDGSQHIVPNRKVLVHSTTGAALSVMSNRFKIHQPKQIADFLFNAAGDYPIVSMGVLGEGQKFWALAAVDVNVDMPAEVDKTRLFVSIWTSCDGTLATEAAYTYVRIVCENTLNMSMRNRAGEPVRVKHNKTFDAEAIRRELGMVDVERSVEEYAQQMQVLQQTEVSREQASDIFLELLRPGASQAKPRQQLKADDLSSLLQAPVGGAVHSASFDSTPLVKPERAVRGLQDLENSYVNAPGAVPGTAYGVLQGVTHYVDHVRGQDSNKRIQSALLTQGAKLKERAVDMLTDMAAT